MKSLVSRVLEDFETKDVEIAYIDEEGTVKRKYSICSCSPWVSGRRDLSKLASVLDVALNEYGFMRPIPANPSSPPGTGIYVSGASESPKDIPETVMQSSGAACEAASIISEARGKDLVILSLPEEKNVDGEEPRIGVFVCNCGINIGGVVNVPEVQAYAKTPAQCGTLR